MRNLASFYALLATYVGATNAQAAAPQRLEPQTNTFGSDFKLSQEQIDSANLSDTAANNLVIATRFEQTNWATGSVLHDPFYTELPANASSAPVGSVLKVEAFTNPLNYTLPPAVALSRIIYQSKTLNGTLVPVSAYILWPYLNRDGAKLAPLVSWGHGSSGTYAECAPSHIRNLWYQYSAPYELALAGYAVVASDYAGLGVFRDSHGKPITHQLIFSTSLGYDLLYAAQAAHAAFPNKVTRDFVVFGHSQGGGAAWAAALNQVKAKVPGYLGAIAASPSTNALELARLSQSSIGLIQAAGAIQAVFPKIPLSSMLTPVGTKFYQLLKSISSCGSGVTQLLIDVLGANPTLSLTKDSFLNSTFAQETSELIEVGGRDFKGPLLVLQGTADTTVFPQLTSQSVNSTCKHFAHNGLHYVQAKGVGHIPLVYAARQIWLSWIDERFSNGKKQESRESRNNTIDKCTFETIGADTPQPLDHYNMENLNYFIEIATSPYQVA